jgi:hypothetical protein
MTKERSPRKPRSARRAGNELTDPRRSTMVSPVTESYRQWRGGVGSCFHGRLEGYAGHLVQVTNDFGELVAVAGRCRSLQQPAPRGPAPLQYPASPAGAPSLRTRVRMCDYSPVQHQLFQAAASRRALDVL